MWRISSALVIFFAASSVQAEPPPTGRIVIDVITVNGTGCPANTAAIAVSPDLRIEAWVDDEVAVEQRQEPDAADLRQVIGRLPSMHAADRRAVDAAKREAQRQQMAARLELARKAELYRRELSASSAPAVKPSEGRGLAARVPQDAR